LNEEDLLLIEGTYNRYSLIDSHGRERVFTDSNFDTPLMYTTKLMDMAE